MGFFLKMQRMYFHSQSKENEEMRISLAELSNSSSGLGDGNGRDGGADLDRDRDGEVWCVQDGRVHEQGDNWEVDSCTSCTCQVSTEQFSFKLQSNMFTSGVFPGRVPRAEFQLNERLFQMGLSHL